MFILLSESALSDSLSEDFIKRLSSASVEIHCKDPWFLEHADISKKTCMKLLVRYSDKCNSLIKPFIPAEFNGVDEDLEKIEKFGKLGEIYSMCLTALTFQKM